MTHTLDGQGPDILWFDANGASASHRLRLPGRGTAPVGKDDNRGGAVTSLRVYLFRRWSPERSTCASFPTNITTKYADANMVPESGTNTLHTTASQYGGQVMG